MLAKQANLNANETSTARVRLLRTLGFKVLADINSVSVIMVGLLFISLLGCADCSCAADLADWNRSAHFT